MNGKLSHIDEAGNASMVDVSEKMVSSRMAIASGRVCFPNTVFETLKAQDFLGKKGSIIQTAIIAGIQGVKKTSELIPLCHQLNLSKVHIDIQPGENALNITCKVKCTERTGVEMEALTGVSVSALTIYDMCKALSQDITISNIQLEQKSGGKHDFNR
ncbi:cyclic pyranopterin monophosphate synthase MoaC [Maribacter polysiphoniae]|uniref:cyclic pyranopterin monophosphate synthase n=1 Tax=Maribacter polysiphoniae TaxID=429344 RepID=A0A316DX07_9FLAO|nr:cyclic pyranopterin monophosphate synthase MoaC [Maribacter polysiphoniae]MBD1263039.1 cyclic pyranopterin monophosphate synthase MoaC [Maribacter polysiphoniae]PWK22028.1 cyclic pyranopterin phosphate synthase [Maribacter polysiphoniae]